MLNCFKKFCIIFLSFTLVSTANAMIIKFLPKTFFGYNYMQNILDEELWKAIRASKYSEQDFKQIEECLNKGANLNAKSNGETPLTFSIISLNTNLMKFFVQYGADINLKNTLGWTPLAYSIFYNQNSNIEILCDSGASLLNLSNFYPGANAFHHAVRGKGDAKEIIQTLMTHVRFDSEKAIINQDQQKKLATAVLALKKWSGGHPEGYIILPEEIQDQIISYLSPDYFQDPKLNSELYNRLYRSGYKHPFILAHIHKRVKNLTKILDSKEGYYNLTPSEWVITFNHVFPDQDNKEVLALIGKDKLQKNWDNFNVGFPDILKSEPNNPVCLMYNNCAKLLEGKK